MDLFRVEQEALALPENERALLAEHLLSGLAEDKAEYDDERWIAEAERRHQEYKAGRLTARSADEVFQDAFQRNRSFL